jgi:hypothetical protein
MYLAYSENGQRYISTPTPIERGRQYIGRHTPCRRISQVPDEPITEINEKQHRRHRDERECNFTIEVPSDDQSDSTPV